MKLINVSSNNIKLWHGTSSQIKIEIHLHDAYELYICHSHSLDYYIEGTIYTLEKGDLVITNMNELHRPIYQPDIAYQRQYIQFTPKALEIIVDENFNPLNYFNLPIPRRQHIIKRHQLEEQGLLPFIEGLFNTPKDPSPAEHLLQRTYLLQLLLKIYMVATSKEECLSSIQPTYVDQRIQNVLHHLNQHYTENFTLDELAQHFHMDKFYLCHLFKTHVGITINKYIQSKRIQHAKMLLSSGQNVTETAYQVGYNDYSNFYKSFCKLVNQSPSDYVKKSTYQ